MTGRGAGYCAGAAQTGYPGLGFGRGKGLGCRRGVNRGGGFGMGRGGLGADRPGGPVAMTPVAVDPATEKQRLTNQSAVLQAELERIKERLTALDNS